MVIASSVVIFLISIVLVGIGHEYMVMKVHPIAAYIILACVLTLMGYVEALHYSCVNMVNDDPTTYEANYPRAAAAQRLVNSQVLLKRFLLGRQGFVIAIVFIVAQLTTFPNMPDDFWGMPPAFVSVLAKTGLPGVALVLTVGQLVSQLFVESYTNAFQNIPGVYSVIQLCLATENIGLCHWSWLLYEISNRLACLKIIRAKKRMTIENAASAETEPLSPTIMNRGEDFDLGVEEEQYGAWDIFRYMWSTALSLGAICVVIYGISTGKYILHVGVAAAYIIAGFTLVLLFYLEGVMIAIAATTDWDRNTWRTVYPKAYAVHEMVNQSGKVKSFIIGRQFMTVLTGFMLAEIFTFANLENPGVYSDILFYVIFKSGLAGVLLVLSVGQLTPELLAAEYPLRFLNLPGCYSLCRLCHFFDSCAVGHAGWAIFYTTRPMLCAGEVEAREDENFLRETPPSAELAYKTYKNTQLISESAKALTRV